MKLVSGQNKGLFISSILKKSVQIVLSTFFFNSINQSISSSSKDCQDPGCGIALGSVAGGFSILEFFSTLLIGNILFLLVARHFKVKHLWKVFVLGSFTHFVFWGWRGDMEFLMLPYVPKYFLLVFEPLFYAMVNLLYYSLFEMISPRNKSKRS